MMKMTYLRLVNNIIILLLLNGCATKRANPTPKIDMCPKFYTYVCEIIGSHKDCWCENNSMLQRKLQDILRTTI